MYETLTLLLQQKTLPQMTFLAELLNCIALHCSGGDNIPWWYSVRHPVYHNNLQYCGICMLEKKARHTFIQKHEGEWFVAWCCWFEVAVAVQGLWLSAVCVCGERAQLITIGYQTNKTRPGLLLGVLISLSHLTPPTTSHEHQGFRLLYPLFTIPIIKTLFLLFIKWNDLHFYWLYGPANLGVSVFI